MLGQTDENSFGTADVAESVEVLVSDDFIDHFDKIAMTSPAKAARQILTAVEKNKRRALIGPDAKAFDLVSRLPAGVSQRVLIAGGKRRRR